MEERYENEAMRERLLIAGIRELEAHGLNDFSLRRVALACEVSCAAPYRHFKSKEDLIIGIISYINKQWLLLENQIIEAFPNDPKKRLVEIGVAHIRFWIANPNFRSVLLMEDPDLQSPRRAERKKISDSIEGEIHSYCMNKSISEKEEAQISYTFRAIIYGTVLLLGNQEIRNDADTVNTIRQELSKVLP